MGATAKYSGLSGTKRTGRQIVPAAGETISRRISFLSEQSRGDPRLLQILFLGVLLAAGAWFRDFSIHPIQIVLTFATAVGCQGLLGRLSGQNPISWRSAFITALGISLLLRADNWWAHPAAAGAAIGSKFAIRLRGKHLFNPANFGVILALILIPGTWVSPGQWGQDVAVAGWLVALGAVVTHRARRGDISWSFLILYLGAIAMRVWWLGQNWWVWVHQFGNGALLLFAFFMISDPMTIPNHWRGRIVHAALVTLFAYVWQFDFYRTNGLLWALFALAPAVPLWGPAVARAKIRMGFCTRRNERHEPENIRSRSTRCGGHTDVRVCTNCNARARDRLLRLLRRQGGHGPLQPCVAGRVRSP